MDGSAAETAAMLESLRPQLPFELKHVLHEDIGFRNCRAINQAIKAAQADYLVFSDGDCIPRADFFSQHLRQREGGRYFGGGYCKLPRALSEKTDEAAIASGDFARAAWLNAQRLPRPRTLKLWARPGWREKLLNALTPTTLHWAGNNASGWKGDLLAVNVSDKRMTYGGEDLELGERLTHAGILGKQIRFSATCVHLDHDRSYVSAAMKDANARIREGRRLTRRTWTSHGITG